MSWQERVREDKVVPIRPEPQRERPSIVQVASLGAVVMGFAVATVAVCALSTATMAATVMFFENRGRRL